MQHTLFTVADFTEEAARDAFEAAQKAYVGASTPKEKRDLLQGAHAKRETAQQSAPLLDAAFTYLTMAQRGAVVETVDPESLFHYAANAFRDLGLVHRAAQCYYKSAEIGYQKYQADSSQDPAFARRSAARAKATFSDIGEDENSDEAHFLQQRIKRAEYLKKKSYLLALTFFLWEKVSGYGTRATNWAMSVCCAVVVFAIAYALLLSAGQIGAAPDIERSGLAFWTSSVYFSVGNLLQFGTLGSISPHTALAQIVFLAHGTVAFVLVGTGATFLTRR